MKKILGIISVLVLMTMTMNAERTTRRGLKIKNTAETVKVVADTVIPDSGMVVISGFDKPLRSSRETFFVSNNYDRTVSSIAVQLVYFDMNGRQLHASDVVVPCYIPAGETRQLSVKSWDSQQSFYYCQSVKPRRDRATPFTVRHRIRYVALLVR